MLKLIQDAKNKRAAQALLERNLKAALKGRGKLNIGFPGGNADETVYSAGQGKLWVAFGKPSKDSAVPRYWNAFGVYEPDKPAQTITVEINIAVNSNSAQVAGFFAEDGDTGSIFLMHSGKVGGGRPGIGKSSFLVWSKAKLVEIADVNGKSRSAIAVGKLGDPNLTERIWAFVRRVHGFKQEATAGKLDTAEFKHRVMEFDRYNREFSGKKRGARGGIFEYVTYHGDIVQKLFDDRTARLTVGEKVFNSPLIDLFVKKEGILSEVYEVKTGTDRQMLYTAIGQLATHASTIHGDASKFLVIPAGETMPKDFENVIGRLGIQVRRFKLSGTVRDRIVELD